MSATDDRVDPRNKQVLGDAEEKQLCKQRKERKTITTKNGGKNDFPFTKISYLI